MVLFEIKNLTFTYPEAKKSALRDISFTVKSGQFIVICGKSGSGKSTLVRHLKAVMSPYGKREGDIFYRGRRIEEASVRVQASEIGYVLQNPASQIVTDKVWHELAFGLENLGYDQKTIRLRVAEMASFFGIQNWFNKNVSELSEGQKQILNLASVMAMQPKALILDEPTAQLDPVTADRFLSIVKKINLDTGITVIMIESRLEEVFPAADKVLMMEDGRLIFYDSPNAVGKALLGSDFFAAMPAPVRIYYGAGGTGQSPLTVREGRRWLEENYEKKAVGEAPVQSEKKYKGRKSGAEYVIEAKNLYFRYDRDGSDVVKDFSLNVKKGELFCILGGNGAGKTTALSLLCGIHKPYRGKVCLGGKDIRKISGKEMFDSFLGVLPQDPKTLFVGDTVREDLNEMIRDLPAVQKHERAEIFDRVIDDMQIRHLLDRHPYDLSTGERQRAALAKVLLLRPKILLLDEPSKGLDGFYRRRLADIFKRLNGEGVTILMVSHDVEFCAEHADTCALFFDGSVVSSAGTKEFFMDNSFYTTAANRMAKSIFPEAVTVKDVIEQCKTNRLKA